MPQFDIASFYPQIIYFAGITIGIYLIVTKSTLPKISQNLKINKKIIQIFENFAIKGLKDINLLSHIYKPKEIIKHLVYKESLSIIFLKKEIKTIILAYIASINWLNKTYEKNKKIKMLKINRIYLKMVSETQ
jgi:hypothetical protein